MIVAAIVLGRLSSHSIARWYADDPSPLYRLVDTAALRLKTADPVSAYKWVKGGPIEDAPRSQQVVDSVGADAKRQGVDPQPVQAVFTDQVHATEGIDCARAGERRRPRSPHQDFSAI